MMFICAGLAVGILGLAAEWPDVFLAVTLFVVGRIVLRAFAP